MREFLKVCEQAARAGGHVLGQWQDRFETREKGPKDLVTDADMASQETIRNLILKAFPDHYFVGEESPTGSEADHTSGQYRWYVDPLDGTVNYVHRLPTYAVSVALEKDGDVLAGVVYDPVRDECFSAVSGGGARLNGRALQPSQCRRLSEALVAGSFSANVSSDSDEIRRFTDVATASQSVRRLGSAALSLCYVAAGRLDAYWATSVKTWDVAAGVLLVREAGGVITAADGAVFQLDRPRLAASATADLHAQLLGALALKSPG